MDRRRPSVNLVNEYLERWNREQEDNFVLKERSLKKLFGKTYPTNANMDDVLIKVSSLDNMYNTMISSPHIVLVANRIFKLNIDQRLANRDLYLVNDIADNEETKEYYSFAAKYCSFHSPDYYPMYDSHVNCMLWHFKDEFCDFQRNKLKCYPKFHEVLMKFIEHYQLEQFDLKQIDHYLWQAYNAQ